MSQNEEKIRAALDQMGQKDYEVVSAYVKSVDEAAATMVVVINDGDLEVEDVMLRGVVTDLTGIILVPEVDSDVVIGSVDGPGEWVLLKASKLAKIMIDVPELLITCPSVVINNGDNKGLLILDQVKDNFDQIKQYLNTLVTAIGSGFTAVGAGSLANGPAGKTAFDGAISAATIDYKNMENTSVKH